jgi:16S rRNA (adenine1518-N6/adenine1519-N6)-dimethyltransferase
MKNISLQFNAKKALGQNFLVDHAYIDKFIDAVNINYTGENSIIEIGPGLGALTKKLAADYKQSLYLVELDKELYDRLLVEFSNIKDNIINADFLKINLESLFHAPLMIVGNLPYNISSPVFFKILKNRDIVRSMIFIIQHEVAQRLSSKPNSKTYGIPSVLIQSFYNVEYLFSIPSTAFDPMPKVTSAVVKLTRNSTHSLDCDESIFFSLVKQAFNQRRKTIRNSLKGLIPESVDSEILNRRAEQLSIQDYVELSRIVGIKATH